MNTTHVPPSPAPPHQPSIHGMQISSMPSASYTLQYPSHSVMHPQQSSPPQQPVVSQQPAMPQQQHVMYAPHQQISQPLEQPLPSQQPPYQPYESRSNQPHPQPPHQPHHQQQQQQFQALSKQKPIIIDDDEVMVDEEKTNRNICIGMVITDIVVEKPPLVLPKDDQYEIVSLESEGKLNTENYCKLFSLIILI